MSDKKDNRIGKDFERAFSEGIENNDWSVLNDVIVRSVDNFLDGVGDKMNEAMGGSGGVPLSSRNEDFSGKTHTAERQRALKQERQRVREEMEKERREREAARQARRNRKRRPAAVSSTELAFPYTDVGAASSVARCLVGGIGLGITAAYSVSGLLAGIIAGTVTGTGIFFSLAFMAGFGVVLARGIAQQKLSKIAARYVEVIGKRQYIDIRTLSLLLNKTEKKVVRELRKLLQAGFFPQGHLDQKETTFILTDEVFGHYLELAAGDRSSGVIDTTARSEDEQEFPTLSPEESAELSRMIRDGQDYIRRFNELNRDIPGVEISAKLDRLEGLLREIFVGVREHPDQMSRIHELMDYYLPTSEKLVRAYREYDRVSEPGEQIISAKKDIEKTLDTINAALGRLLNKLFKDSVLDVTTDAQVLQTILAQKGLSNGPEDNMKGEQ
ncbi:MAG: 5-bromo-4-chloroindolyl phosphate hydrolysis family protein [Lachnospiraceae bacterium]|nr:5-bromo-4-chloroindolyl phosphate hydrolysis family protein [Lachnospiraceae bacterium]